MRETRHRVISGCMVFLGLFLFLAGMAWAAPFVNNLDGTVTDIGTGLIWQQADNGTTEEWEDAVAYCESLPLGGYDDWRAPRIDELETIIDFSTYNPAITPVFSAEPWWYWSSSAKVIDTYRRFAVHFYDGAVGSGGNNTISGYVRCVRGGPFWPPDPTPNYQSPSPNTVLDTYRGYMWQKGDSGDTPLTWDEAKAYCAGRDLDGYTDWRLPEIEVLLTIVNYTTELPALSMIFDPGRSNLFWSSSTAVDAGFPDEAWVVFFMQGHTSDYGKDNPYYARCVRSGPESLVPLTLNKNGPGTGRVTSDPPRIDCGTDCPSQTENFAQMTHVILTAQADPGMVFMGWSGGGCSGTDPCELTMGAEPVTVTATFFPYSATVPTLSEWGLMIFATLMAASACWGMRRRRTC